jgi:hypothetical protein
MIIYRVYYIIKGKNSYIGSVLINVHRFDQVKIITDARKKIFKKYKNELKNLYDRNLAITRIREVSSVPQKMTIELELIRSRSKIKIK